MAQAIFAITIFVSAFLLFLVQPLIGKLILPKLGGTPQVWNTCMVFFQSVLLLGYAYTHTISTRLKFRQQLMLHGALLIIPIIMMALFPVYTRVHEWTPPPGSNPIFDTLGLLAMIIGVPFFVVSTSAPLLQKWFAYSGDKSARDPYFLYAISNLGSLLSLLLYPLIIEPNTFLESQSYIWFGGYIVLAALILFCAYTISKLAPSDAQIEESEAAVAPPPPPPETPAPATALVAETGTAIKSGPAPAVGGARSIQRKKGAKIGVQPVDAAPTSSVEMPRDVVSGADAPMTWFRRIRWVLLAFVPSSLMLGVTNYISTDMSPFPLVWVIPLAFYLLSFIIVYDKYVKWTSQPVFGTNTFQDMILYAGQPIGVIILCFISIRGGFDVVGSTILVMIGFFTNALACHGELAQDRPATKHLTEYFLLMSFGGMLGGMFNGIIAPIAFEGGVYEYYIVIVIACMIRPQYVSVGWFDDLILNAFPGFKGWVVNQGNEMAKSFGSPAPNSTYLFSYFLDIVLGVFILAISYWLRFRYFDASWIASFLNFMGAKVTRENQDGLFSFLRVALTLGPPLVFLFFFAGRPWRFGLATCGVLLGIMYFAQPDRGVLEARRTYFGLLRVMREDEKTQDPEEQKLAIRKMMRDTDGREVRPDFFYNYLMHGTTYHGRNYLYDTEDARTVEYINDMSRLSTTYYHRYGPVGPVMERYNWFPGAQNDFSADARLPASMVGQMATSLGFSTLPLPVLANVWTEPPYATIGLGTGTMASYARPYQCMTYYEIDEVMRGFSLPEDKQPGRFTYLQNAIRRGVNLEMIMGDARLTMQREANNENNTMLFWGDFSLPKGRDLPKSRPYSKVNYDSTNTKSLHREKFYKVIVVDAFSSDAIPIHLVTKQAIKLYLDKLTDDGVLCVHTSNRHMDLVRPVARIAMELSKESVKEFQDDTKKIYCKVGKDRIENFGQTREYFMGHFSSEYVMIYKDAKVGEYLDELFKTHEDLFQKWVDKEGDMARKFPLLFPPPKDRPILRSKVEWYDPYVTHKWRFERPHIAVSNDDKLWTDDYSHILSVVRWHLPWWFWWVVGPLGLVFVAMVGMLIINRRR